LLIARGVQNKVLEAMAMTKPVVLTPGAATGVDAVDGLHFAISQPEPDAMLKRIEALLSDADKRIAIGNAARQFVVENMCWDRIDVRLARLLDGLETDRDAA